MWGTRTDPRIRDAIAFIALASVIAPAENNGMTRRPLIVVLLALSFAARNVIADESKPSVGESFQIESVAHAGQLLRVEDARSADGTPMVLYPQQAWKCMTWQLQADGDDVRLKNHFTKKTLTPANTPKAPSSTAPADAKPDAPMAVVQRPLAKTPEAVEAWKFVPIEGKAGVFQIVHAQSGLALEAGEDGRVVASKPASKPADAPSQQWRLLKKPEHFTG
jgi:hypothetical protein